MPSRSALDLRSQVGQMLIMGFEGIALSARLRTAISGIQPGGIILFRRNIESATQVYNLLRECQSLIGTPAFFCVDLEGGTVDRFRDVIAPSPSVASIAATGNLNLFRKHARILGEECCAMGFNVDFAPALDLRLPPSEHVLASRTVSPDPKETVLYAREMLRGLAEVKVIGCGKHFPGLGEGSLDSHKDLPVIRKAWKRLWDEDLYPYRALAKELPIVMVAHCAYPDVTGDNTPASMSKKWITDVLRGKIGYKGLVSVDDMEMGGMLAAASIGEAGVRAVRAGADLLPVCRQEEAVWQVFEAVLREADRDKRFAARVQDSANRIITTKKKSPALKRRPKPPSEKLVESLRRKIWEFTEEIRLETDAIEYLPEAQG